MFHGNSTLNQIFRGIEWHKRLFLNFSTYSCIEEHLVKEHWWLIVGKLWIESIYCFVLDRTQHITERGWHVIFTLVNFICTSDSKAFHLKCNGMVLPVKAALRGPRKDSLQCIKEEKNPKAVDQDTRVTSWR